MEELDVSLSASPARTNLVRSWLTSTSSPPLSALSLVPSFLCDQGDRLKVL